MTGSSDQSPAREESNPSGFRHDSHPLLSQERVQKFNLLLHLIANISGPIVVRGPEGIGKSTVLKEVKSRSLDTWNVCFVEAWSDLNLDRMFQMLSTTASFFVNPSLIDDSKAGLGAQLKWMEENSLLLVLLLDDAGTVAPGLLQTLRQFAESHPALRLVYSMKPEDSLVMGADGVAIGDCRFVDLPPLTERQCGEFIGILSIDSQRPESFPAMTSSLIRRVYKETHGVPGEILKVLSMTPKNKSYGEKNKITLRSVFLVVLILSVISLFIWISSFQDWFFSRESALSGVDGGDKRKIQLEIPSVSGSMPVVESGKLNASVEKAINNDKSTKARKSQESENPMTVKVPRVGIPEIKESINPKKTLIKEKTKQQKQTIVALRTQVDQSREEAPSLIQADRAIPNPTKKKSRGLGITGVKGADWLLSQEPTKWTVQLIAVSQLDALKSLIAKHSDLKPLAAIRSRTKGKDFFSLYYGSFNTLDEAKIAIKKLPPFFNKPWPIIFQVVHKKIKPKLIH